MMMKPIERKISSELGYCASNCVCMLNHIIFALTVYEDDDVTYICLKTEEVTNVNDGGSKVVMAVRLIKRWRLTHG